MWQRQDKSNSRQRDNGNKKNEVILTILVVLFFAFFALTVVFNILSQNDEIFTVFTILSTVCLATDFIFLCVKGKKRDDERKGKEKRREENTSFWKDCEDRSIEECLPEPILRFYKAVERHFPDLPFPKYQPPSGLLATLRSEVEKGKPTIVTLQSITMDMERHISLKEHAIIHIEENGGNNAGYIEKHDSVFSEISIFYSRVYDERQYLAILAHEISHEYQFSLSMQSIFSEQEQEVFTDFLTFYLGFGDLTKEGKNARKTTSQPMSDGQVHLITETARLGYLDEIYFHYGDYCPIRLKNDREKKAKLDRENRMYKRKLSELIVLVPKYFEQVQTLLSSLKEATLSELDLLRVQSVYMRRDEGFVERFQNKAKNYENNDHEANKNLLSYAEAEMESLLIDQKALMEIASNNKEDKKFKQP